MVLQVLPIDNPYLSRIENIVKRPLLISFLYASTTIYKRFLRTVGVAGWSENDWPGSLLSNTWY